MTQPNFFLAQKPLFKPYDIRGERKLFTPVFVYALASAFAAHFKAHQVTNSQPDLESSHPLTVVLGYDVRHGSQHMAHIFCHVFTRNNIKVVWLGMVTTPMMAYWAQQYQGHGICMTASHSQGCINGVKWLVNGQSPNRQNINAIYQLLQTFTPKVDLTASANSNATDLPQYCQGGGLNNAAVNVDEFQPCAFVTILPPSKVRSQYVFSAIDALTTIWQQPIYKNFIAGLKVKATDKNLTSNNVNQQNCENFGQDNLSVHAKTDGSTIRLSAEHTVIVDCLNATTSVIAADLFQNFLTRLTTKTGQQFKLIILNDTIDADFTKGNPDPTEHERLNELKQAVITHNAILGLAFDGDGDRLMVVDDKGQVIAPDHLLYILAQIALHDSDAVSKDSSCYVIYDVKCSHHLEYLLQKLGAKPQICKTGSNIMRKLLQSGGSQALFAGELSGHFIFNDGYFILHDDALYAALRLLNWLSFEFYNLSDIIGQLPSMVNTPDVYLPLSYFDVCQQTALPTSTTIANKLAKLCNCLQASCPMDVSHAINQSIQFMHLNQPKQLGLPEGTRLTCIDGIRLDFNNGFGVMRLSNTSASLTVRFAGNSLSDLNKVQHRFVQLCEQIDKNLAAHIAKISPSGYNSAC